MAAAYKVAPVELECSICLELLKEPTELVCTHTFCKDCLLGLYLNKSTTDTVDCPLCRKITILENGNLSKLTPNRVLKSAVNAFQERLRSLQERGESKIMSLINDITLANEVEDTVRRCHSKRIGDIENAFKEKLATLTKQMQDFKEVCNQEQNAQLMQLSETRESKTYLICSIGTACDAVKNGTNALMEGPALSQHEVMCRQLEEMLDGSSEAEYLRRITKRAEDLRFTGHKGHFELSIGTLDCVQRRTYDEANPGVTVEEFPLSTNKVMGVAITPEGSVAIGYRVGGIEKHTVRDPPDFILTDVNIWGLAITSTGNYVVRDRDNNISIYTPDLQRHGVTFNALDFEEGGLGDLAVGDDDTILISYWQPSVIQAFSQEGGNPIREIESSGFVPSQICAMKGSTQLVIGDGCTVSVIDEYGTVAHEVTEPGRVACPAVIDGGIVFIAWVDDQEGLVTIGMYSSDLTRIQEMIKDFSVVKTSPGRCFLRTLANGTLAFSKGAKLYIFTVPLSSLCAVL